MPPTFETFERELTRLVAKFEKERGVLQNAVDSTDRKIDDLVYELYGLTPEEIAIVEGTAK